MAVLNRLQGFLLTVLLATGSAGAQSASAVFIQKDSTAQGGYHAVYIETDTASPGYDGIALSEEGIRRLSKNLISHPAGAASTRQRLPEGLPRSWVPLHRYEGNYYVYHPCDGIAASAVALTDSTIIQYQGAYEESGADYLSGVRKSDSKNFALLYYQSSDDSHWTEINITIIDTMRHIAVFRRNCTRETCDSSLMIDAAMIRRFPVIVNDCRTSKWAEFKFDKIDYKALLK